MMDKRFKITGFVIIGIGIMLSFYAGPKVYRKYNSNKARQEWRVNFPQTINYVDKLPNPDSLYVFILAGQSNMAGRGFVESHDTLPNKRILTIDKSMKWIFAKEPLHFYEPSLTGLDCGMSFAKSYLIRCQKGFQLP
ncbi:MAG: sialate O-acetylesterase [Bacteroidales bacterium]|nr:sialate O-acetylesterase [Bacteroidales bacterium]